MYQLSILKIYINFNGTMSHWDSLDVLDVLPVFQLPLWSGWAFEEDGATALGVDSYTAHSYVTLEPQ